ncbi:MAG: hypothetical protein R6V12_08005 [Candidatus Hydrogenedentota bacterium]
MRRSTISHSSLAALLCALLFLAVSVPAQEPFRMVPAETKLRDVAVDARSGILFFAAYTRGEVWKVNGSTGEVLAKVKSGKGPAHLSLSSDGRLLASVNTLSANAVVFDAKTMVAVGTFTCEDGASDVVALENAAFAVVNSFANSVTCIDVENKKTTVIEDIGQVPNGVAFSEPILGVTTRVPAAILLLDTSHGYTDYDGKRIDLPATPVAVTAESGRRFLVATEDGLVRIDGRTGKITARTPIKAKDIAVCKGRIFALSGKTLVELDRGLAEVGRTSLEVEATQVGCSGGLVSLVAPGKEAWLVRGTAVSAAAEAPGAEKEVILEPDEPLPAPEEKPIRQPSVQDKEPVKERSEPRTPLPARTEEEQPESPESGPPAVIEAEPVRESKEQELEPFPALAKPGMKEESAPGPEPKSPVLPENEKEVPDSGEVEVQPQPQADSSESTQDLQYPEQSPYAQRPQLLTTFRTGAPRFAREAPAAIPSEDIWSGGLSKAFTQGWDFASLKGAFEEQDWERPLEFRGLSAGQMRAKRGPDGNVQSLTFEGDVSWDWAESAFHAQLLNANRATREIIIEDGRLERELSSLDVDRVYYRYPEELDEASFPLIETEELTEQERARRRYTLGYGEAENVELMEPFRELRARHVEYDFAQETGGASKVRGRLDVLYFGIEELEITGPGEAHAEDVWLTTCPGDPPFFRLRLKEMDVEEGEAVVGRKARLQIGKVMTPIYWPKWTFRPGMDRLIDIDFDSGRAAELGYYINYGQRFAVSKEAEVGFRFFPTEHEGVGLGLEGEYDYMTKPSSPLFRGKGDFRTMVTTKERGYAEAYHRQELFEDTVMLFQTEYWEDRDIIKDFYYNEYRDRTEPRSFVNVTHTRPSYVATGTLRYNVSDFVVETERLPEVSYHLLERQLADRLYITFDTIEGYNEREPSDTESWRMANIGRASLDLDLGNALNIVPFYEADLSWYSKTVDEGESDARFSNTVGVTTQSRFHRAYAGKLGFSGFKHVIVPSVTYSYRPEPTMGVDETPRFDAYDNVYGRSRIESKISNILFVRDALSGEVWQGARLTLYQGDDFWNEIRSSTDYEVELDLRPRPWWGILTVGEHHSIENDIDLDEPYLYQRLALEAWERITGSPYDAELAFQYNAIYGDYDRILSYLYYDDISQGGKFGARLGFAYTKTQDRFFNREILYGARYKLSDRWAFAFEHRYDLERNELYQQEYEIRKRFECFDWSIMMRDRGEGWDFNVAISLSAFPGTKVEF